MSEPRHNTYVSRNLAADLHQMSSRLAKMERSKNVHFTDVTFGEAKMLVRKMKAAGLWRKTRRAVFEQNAVFRA